MSEYNENQKPNGTQSGERAAIASLVCGVASFVSLFLWYKLFLEPFVSLLVVLSLVLGIAGIICASNAKKAGYNGGIQTAGFVVSIVGLVFVSVFFMSCIACYGVLEGIISLF